ncbi:MAG: radical SAM protein [Desulfobacteraceae bacterium]
MNAFSIKRLASGGVITNYSCVSRCGHCLYNCGPHRSRDYLDGVMAAKIFRSIVALGCRSVHIGGGEPLLHPKKLRAVAAAARDAGVGIDYVETNSAWFVDADQARGLLEDLRAVGVDTLLVSISPFHNAFIPYAKVSGVIDACRRTDMSVFPWVNAFVKDLTRLDVNKTHALDEFTSAFGAGYLEHIPDRYWIHLGGRALATFGAVYPKQPVEEVLAQSPGSCARALADTSHFHIDLYGQYIPGLCAGLAIAMDDLGDALPPGKYALLEQLAVTGTGGLYELAAERYGFRPRSDGYLNHCDLCTDIRGFLWRTEGVAFEELAPDGFYN